MFPDLVGPELDSLAEQAEKVSFAPGDTIVAEGDLANRFYVIAQGEVAISRRSPEGDEVKLATLGRGQFFGEVGILAETRRTATVRALADVELLALSWRGSKSSSSGRIARSEISPRSSRTGSRPRHEPPRARGSRLLPYR